MTTSPVVVGMGSSPLARGLPPSRRPPTVRARIIPARAGFTRRRRTGRRHRPDHPRSRGVYNASHDPNNEAYGSSPLARGLPPGPHRRAANRRIIPARAGFTRRRYLRGREVQDHPRSRGVYWVQAATGASRAGSSPLARGLLADGYEVTNQLRIIPARAGFTHGQVGADRRDGDHPRSRGVYPPRR